MGVVLSHFSTSGTCLHCVVGRRDIFYTMLTKYSRLTRGLVTFTRRKAPDVLIKMLFVSAMFSVGGVSYCQHDAAIQYCPTPNVAQVTNHLSPQSVVAQEARSFWEMSLAWLVNAVKAAARCGMLCLYFLGPCSTLPVVWFCNVDTLYVWWWNMFRSSICNAGPSFIKLAQVSFHFLLIA